MISGGMLAFDGLYDIAGNLIHFTVATDGRKPRLKGCRLLSDKHGVFEFEVDLTELSVRSLLERLSRAEGIMDVRRRRS